VVATSVATVPRAVAEATIIVGGGRGLPVFDQGFRHTAPAQYFAIISAPGIEKVHATQSSNVH
jgi:hypothetical protein